MNTGPFGYLASISAVLCGFGFSFLGVLFVLGKPSIAIDWTTRLSAVAAASLLICALGWTLLAAMPANAETNIWGVQHRVLSLVFPFGVLCMLLALAASGWIRSQRMGLFTSCVALLALAGAAFVISPFIT